MYGIDEESIDTLIHEAWHQFFHVLCENQPIWLDEGLAEFLGKFDVHKGGKDIELGVLVRARGDVYTRYERIREFVREGKHIPLKEFLYMGNDDWDEKDPGLAYAQSWAVAYYALKGDNKTFQKAYIKLFWGCVEGKEWRALVDELFPEKDIAAYEAAWLKYIKKL